VLPDRIELSTSPLPMECSTTELRQHAPIRESAKKAPTRRADPCHKAPTGASASRRRCRQKRYKHRWAPAACFKRLNCGPIRFHLFLAQYHHLEFDHFGSRNANGGFSSIGFASD
jgi:hypothetical protein